MQERLIVFLSGVIIGACFLGYPFGGSHNSFKLNLIWSLDDLYFSERELSSTKTKKEVLQNIQDKAIERYEIMKRRLYFESVYSFHFMIDPKMHESMEKAEEVKNRILRERDKSLK